MSPILHRRGRRREPEALRDGSVDLDIGAGEITSPDIRSVLLYRERVVAIVRANGPLGQARRRRSRDSAGIPTFLSPGGAAFLVASSDYIGLVPQRLAEQYGRSLGNRWFPIPTELRSGRRSARRLETVSAVFRGRK